MLKASVIVRLQNEYGTEEAIVLTREGKDTESVEREIIQDFYIDGGSKICEAIYAIKMPVEPLKTIATKKGNKNGKS
jgi:hypothetical protein